MNNNLSKAKILFRADGNSEIGLGHIYRCLAIAERLSETFDCYFATRVPSHELKHTISRYATLIELPQYLSYAEEATDLTERIFPAYHFKSVTLDGYYFDTIYQKIWKEKSDALLISIDDDQPFHYVSDVVVNHAGGLAESAISKEYYTKVFLGNNYSLLRKTFIDLQQKAKTVSAIDSMLVCFGGADPLNFTQKTVDCFKQNSSLKRITIVLGISYLQAEKLKFSINEYPHIEIKSNLDAATLATLMLETDIAVVPASTIGLEAFAAKLILITGLTAPNQINIYKGLLKEETVTGIDNFEDLNCEKLMNALAVSIKKFTNYTFPTKRSASDSLVELYKSLL